MEYFYSHIAENDLNRDFIVALRNYAEEVKEQIYLLQHPLTDSKYSYEVHDVGIVLMRKHKIAFVSFKKDNRDQFEDTERTGGLYHIGNAGELGMQDIDCTHTGKGNGNKGRETKKTTGKDSRIPADEVFAGAHKRGFA